MQDNLEMRHSLKDKHKPKVDKHLIVRPTSQDNSEPGEFVFSHSLGNRTFLDLQIQLTPINQHQSLG